MSGEAKSRVAEFYRDSVILITGATGFMGQVLLEKIVFTLKPKRIYVLLRRKRGKDVHQRLEEILRGEHFHRVHRSGVLSRIIPLEVDFDQDQLALDAAQQRQLAAEVDVVFHLMATVSFLDSLEDSLRINVEYTRHLFTLIRTFQRLRVLMHVSTFYSNGDQPLVQEKIYDDISFGGYDNVKSILAKLNAEEKIQLTPFVLKALPNSYIYSKKCVESVIEQSFSDLPIGVFRPPIVTSSYREPIPGWTNNLNGPCGVLAAIHKGILRAFPVDFRKRVLFAPVDYCVNALLGCAVDVARRSPDRGVLIYNYAEDMPDITWGRMKVKSVGAISPLRKVIFGHLLMIFTKRAFLYRLGCAVMRLQAWIVDFFSGSKAKRRTMRSITERVISYVDAISYFCLNEWRLENGNVRRVVESLESEDSTQYPCDLRRVDWDEHFRSIAPGLVRFVLEQPKTGIDTQKPVKSLGSV